MKPAFLLPDVEARESGQGPAFDLGPASGRPLNLTLGITRILEDESLDVSIFASSDGETWEETPLLSFPKRCYCGNYSAMVDLSKKPAVKFLRATWQMYRWNKSEPLFDFFIKAEEVRVAAAVA